MPRVLAALHHGIGRIAGPLAVIAVALVLIWLGVIKLHPAWNPGAAQGEEFIQLLGQGKVDSSSLLAAMGVIQVIAGITLLIPRARLIASLCLILLLATVVVFTVMHLGAISGSSGTPNGAGLGLAKTAALLLCGLAVSARAVPAKAPTT